MNKQTRKITEGAMMCAIVGLVLFINRQLGNMLEYFMYWVLTFPILVYTAKYGVHNALVPSVSMLLLSFMISSPTTIFYLFSCIVVGLVYGGGVRKGWKNGTLLVFSGIFTFFSYLVTTVLLAAVFGYEHPYRNRSHENRNDHCCSGSCSHERAADDVHPYDWKHPAFPSAYQGASDEQYSQYSCFEMERMADSCHLGSILQWKCAKIKPGSFDDTAGGLPCLQGPCNRLRSDVYHGTAGAVTKARICVAVDDCSLCALCTGCHCRNRHCGYPVSAER